MNKMRYLLTALAMVMMSSPVYASTTAPPATVGALVNIKFTPIDPAAVGSFPLYSYSGGVSYGGGTSNFGGTSSAAITVGTGGDYWNNINPDVAAGGSVSTALSLAQGFGSVAPGLTFTAEGLGTIYKNTAFYGTDYNTLMNTYVWTSDTATMTISKLNANTNYDVYVLTQGSKSSNGSQLVLAGLNSSGVPTTFTQNGTSNAANSTFVAGTNYMFETFKTDANGNLTFAYSSANGKNAIINGLQVVGSAPNTPPTPEPASMVLIGVGGALMSAMKLRKKKAAENPVA